MKVEDIYSPKYREIAQFIENNDIYDFAWFCAWCAQNNEEWFKVLFSYKGNRFFYKWFFYKNMDRKRKEETERKKKK